MLRVRGIAAPLFWVGVVACGGASEGPGGPPIANNNGVQGTPVATPTMPVTTPTPVGPMPGGPVEPPVGPGNAPNVSEPTGGGQGGPQTPPTPEGPVAMPEGPTTTPAPSADAWTQMGFDERNWYFNPNETTLSVDNASQLTVKWTFEVAGFPPGSPLIVDGVVYVMATGGTYAIDLETGKELWSRTDISGTSSLAFADGALYAHSNGATLFRLDPKTGQNVWGPAKTYDMAGCDGTSSPVIAGNLVLVGHACGGLEVGANAGMGMAKGGVEAHSLADGSKVWTYITTEGSEDGAMVWSTVSADVEAGVVYAGTGNNYTVGGANSDSIHAISLDAGTRIWRKQVNTGDTWSLRVAPAGPDTDFGSNPIVVDGMVAAGDKGSSFWALDDQTGEILWSRTKLTASRDAAHGGILMNGAFDGNAFYALVNTGGTRVTKLVALKKDDGTDLWPAKTFNKTAWGAPTIANGVIYAPVDDELHVLNAATGEELTSFTTGGTIAAGAPAVAQGHVVVGSGLSYFLDATAKNNNEVICYGLP